jgi:hypothetical protein
MLRFAAPKLPCVMSASFRSPTFGRTIGLGRFCVRQTISFKVASHRLVVAVPDDGINSTNVITVSHVVCIGFGDQPVLHPTGSSIKRGPGVMSASIGCQACGAALRRGHPDI